MINKIYLYNFRGQINEKRICPEFSQYWRGLRSFFFTGQMFCLKPTRNVSLYNIYKIYKYIIIIIISVLSVPYLIRPIITGLKSGTDVSIISVLICPSVPYNIKQL